jgi:hypothetical protein
MPQLVVRRKGRTALESVFVAVHEPFHGRRHIARAERLETTADADGAVAVRVRIGNRTDTILLSPDGAASVETQGRHGVALDGRLGFVSRRGGKVTAAYLIGGTRLVAEGVNLKAAQAEFRGEIEGASRTWDGADADAFATSSELPAGTRLRGSWLVVTHPDGCTHGYGIERVEARDGKTWIHVSGDHGLRIRGETTQECRFPQREFHGPNRFVVYTTATLPRGRR